MSNDILCMPINDTKLKIAAMYYKDSEDIDLSHLGMSGVLQLQNKDEKSPKQLQFGFSIALAPAPYSKTVLLTIAPKYVMVNMLEN